MAITPAEGRLEAGAPTEVFAKLRIAVGIPCRQGEAELAHPSA